MSNAKYVGGKARNLQKLVQLGQRVPPFFSLTSLTIARSVSEVGRVELAEVELSELKAWVSAQQSLGHTSFIVRSSAINEDGLTSSYAGQFESIPNLRSLTEITEGIDLCYQSSKSERVRVYQEQSGESGPAEIAVIVQVMVDAEISGVLFTANPTNGSRREFLVSSNFGACEAVVSGLYDCDEFTLSPFGQILSEKISKKDKELRFCEKRRGLQEQVVSIDKQDKSSVSPEHLQKLCEIGRELTEKEGQALDLEWVIAKETIFIVQMRPITSLKKDSSAQRKFVFDNSNIQESFNGLTLPLTFSFAREAYFAVYSQLMVVMGFSQKEVKRHDRRHYQMLALVKGRVYYNINSWYEGLLVLPSFARNKEDMEAMMGVEEPVDFVVDHELSFSDKLRRLPAITRLLVRLGLNFHNIEKLVRKFRNQFEDSYQGFDRRGLRWMSPSQICEVHDKLKEQVLGNWKAPIINDFYVMMMAGRVRRRLTEVELLAHLPDLLAGEDLESLAPTLALLRIAELIQSKPDLFTSLDQSQAEDSFVASLQIDTEVSQALEAFIENYGDRIIGELKLESRSFRQEPLLLVPLLKNYIFNPSLCVEGLKKRQFKLREEAEFAVFGSISRKLGRRALAKFKRDLAAFRRGVRQREAMRLDRTRSFGLFRSIYCELGQKLFEQGHLNSPRDVFYLTFDEIDRFYHGQSFTEHPSELVDLRKNQYGLWASEEAPSHLPCQVPICGPIEIFSSHSAHATQPELEAGNYQGLGCYPGKVTAEVIRLDVPDMGVDVRGKIIVTQRTDPGWTPLFVGIKALIVEKGSQLSHSAVVARELGIPSVVSVPGICSLLKTGDMVELDGALGTIKKIEDEIIHDTRKNEATSPLV